MNWKVATLVLIVAAYMVVAACLLGGLWPLVKRVRDRRGRVTGRHRQDAEAVTVTITAVALPLAPLPEMMLSAPVAVPGASLDASTMVLPFTPDWRRQTADALAPAVLDADAERAGPPWDGAMDTGADKNGPEIESPQVGTPDPEDTPADDDPDAWVYECDPEDIAAAELAAYALEYAGVTGEPALHDPAWPPWVPWRLDDELDERLVPA